jgi:hypothetical protein
MPANFKLFLYLLVFWYCYQKNELDEFKIGVLVFDKHLIYSKFCVVVYSLCKFVT